MKRSELIAMRDDCFQTIITACQSAGPVPTWTSDSRMTMTMLHLVYQTVVTQLAQVDGDEKLMKLAVLLDEAKRNLHAARTKKGSNDEQVHQALLGVIEAMDTLEG